MTRNLKKGGNIMLVALSHLKMIHRRTPLLLLISVTLSDNGQGIIDT